MSDSTNRATMVAFSCRPNSGSEWGVGWNYLLMLAEIHSNVDIYVRDAENQIESIDENLTTLGIKNINVISVSDVKLVYKMRSKFSGPRLLLIDYLFWLFKVFGILLIKRRWKYDYSFYHITWVSDWIWSPFFLLPYRKKIIGPLGSQTANFDKTSPDYAPSKRRFFIKTLLRHNPLNWLNAYLADYAIGISKLSIERYPWKLVKKRIVVSPVHSELSNTKPFNNKNVRSLVFIGKHLDFKNLDLFAEISTFIIENNPMIKVVVFGDTTGKLSPKLKLLKESYPEQVKITGVVNQKEIQEHFDSTCSIMLQTSSEAGGTAPVEAISCGVPVICAKGYGLDAFLNSDYKYCVEYTVKNEFVSKAAILTEIIWANYNSVSQDMLDLSNQFSKSSTLSSLKFFLER